MDDREEEDEGVLCGEVLVGGGDCESVRGEIVYAEVGLSFWGGMCPETGVVIDVRHPLHGECVTGKVLCLPSGRGSCTGSQVVLELLLNGVGPAAILLKEKDDIISLGAIVAEELFEKTPMRIVAVAVRGLFGARGVSLATRARERDDAFRGRRRARLARGSRSFAQVGDAFEALGAASGSEARVASDGRVSTTTTGRLGIPRARVAGPSPEAVSLSEAQGRRSRASRVLHLWLPSGETLEER